MKKSLENLLNCSIQNGRQLRARGERNIEIKLRGKKEQIQLLIILLTEIPPSFIDQFGVSSSFLP